MLFNINKDNYEPAMSRNDVVAAASAAVRETGLDHGVLVAAALPHPPEVAVADTFRTRAVPRAAPVQTVA